MKIRFQPAPGLVAALACLLAVPAVAGELYSWRTENGAYAFTDDEKSIPARYRDAAERRSTAALDDYERFTPEDSAAKQHYAEALEARLERLRALNAGRAVGPTVATSASGDKTVSLQVSGRDAPSVDITAGENSEPVIIETIRTRPEGKMVTRPSTVIRQGDRTLAIIKPRSREWDVNRDIIDEAELER